MNSIDFVSNNCTLVIIAHRLSTVMNADRIYEFNSGEIIHSGTFEELCKVSESFKDLNLLEKKILKRIKLFLNLTIYNKIDFRKFI